MKRKFSSMVAVALAMGMVMGNSVTALALEGDGSADNPYLISTMETGDTLEIYDDGNRQIFVKNDMGRAVYMYGECPDSPTDVCFADKKSVYEGFPVYITDINVGDNCNWGLATDEARARVTIQMSAPVPPDNTQPTSEYNYNPWDDYATPMIDAAEAGQTITFEFDEWNSFPKSFMAKLADKSAQNITFVFHYKWDHVEQEITIPAGTPIDLSCDWYGPAKMAELYGAN